MIVYFTGTGNSRYLAHTASSVLDDDMINAGDIIKSGKKYSEFHSEKPWVFICPVYAWRIPRIFSDFIMSNGFRGNRCAYFIVNCGQDIGCAQDEIEKICLEKSFTCMGTAEIWMPENYIAMFTAPDEKEADNIISEADIMMENLLETISSRKKFPKKKTGYLDSLKSGIVNSLFYTFCVKASPFYSTDNCISCGLCEKLCPLNNIVIDEGRPKWGRDCTHCMACICGCPKNAIEYGKKTKYKRRYYLK